MAPSSFTDTRGEVLERMVSVGAAEEDDTTPLVSSVSRCHGEARALFVAGKEPVPLKSPVVAMMRPEVTSSWAETKLLKRTRTRALPEERGEEESKVGACGKRWKLREREIQGWGRVCVVCGYVRSRQYSNDAIIER